MTWLDEIEERAAKAIGPKPNWNTEEWVAELSQLIGKDIPRLVNALREYEEFLSRVVEMDEYDLLDIIPEARALLKGGDHADKG